MLATGNKSLTGYRLSIRFSADGFSFSVLSTLDGSELQTDRFPVSEKDSVTDILRQALQKPYLMDYRFQSVEFATDAPSTIVPLEHFSKSEMLAFYRLCFPREQARVADMQYQLLPSLEAVMIFSLDQPSAHGARILSRREGLFHRCIATGTLCRRAGTTPILGGHRAARCICVFCSEAILYCHLLPKQINLCRYAVGKQRQRSHIPSAWHLEGPRVECAARRLASGRRIERTAEDTGRIPA